MNFLMRNRMKPIAFILLFVMLACTVSGAVFAGSQADGLTIAVDMKIGFDKFYKLGYSVPLYFELDNKLKDFSGELQVELPTEYETVMLYAVPVNLPKDSVKKLVVNIPMTRFLSKLKVNLAEGKNQLVSKTFRIDPGVSAETMVIGVLSDTYDRIQYINSVSLQGTGAMAVKNLRLDEAVFPEEPEVLKAFNVILINDFDTAKLNIRQYENLKNWTMEGGLLIIGTGPSYNKTLAVFKDDFLAGQTGQLSMVETEALAGFVTNKTGSASTYATAGVGQSTVVYGGAYGSGRQVVAAKAVRVPTAVQVPAAAAPELTGKAASLTLNVLAIQLKDSMPVIAEGNLDLVQRVDRDRGSVLLTSFDLGMEPLAGWIGSGAFADRLLSTSLNSLTGGWNLYKGGPEQNIYAMDSAIRNIPEIALPKISYMILVFALYILLAGPVSYTILKRMDRRELLWLTVPVLSLVFSGAVYISGFGTRMTEPVVNVISVLNYEKRGAVASKTYAGIFTPTKNNIVVKSEGEGRIRPLFVDRGRYGSVGGNEQVSRIEAKVNLAPLNTIEYYKTGVWSMKAVMLEDGQVSGGSVEGSLNYGGESFTGSVTNNSGFDLEECYIITANQYMKVGAIRNGETASINAKPSSYFGNRYDLLNAIYKDPYSGPAPLNRLNYEEIRGLRESMQKRQVLEYSFLSQDLGNREAVLMGWSRRSGAQNLLVNEKQTKRYEKSLILADVDISFRSGNTVEYPYGFIRPDIVGSPAMGNFDEMNKTFYGSGTMEVHYPIDRDIQVEGVKIKYTVGTPNIRQFIWNASTKSWEQGDYTSFSIDGENTGKYVDENNLMRLKFEISDDNMQLPEISVKGSVK